eukprot:g4330.t1
MPNRRDVLKGAIAAGGVAAIGSSETARANWGMPLPQTEFDGRSLINYSRAYQIMDEFELDGLIAMNPINVFYLSNYLGYNVKMQMPNASFAVFPRDENKSVILVAGFGDLWNLSEGGAEYPQIIPYSMPFGMEGFDPENPMATQPVPAPPFSKLFQVNETDLASLEKTWLSYDDRFEGEMMPSSEYALIRALKESGLENARVAVDDMRIPLSLEKLGHTSTTCVEGDNSFRKIRVVKSDVEIGHMRRIAQVNQIATMNMLKQLDVGATEADIDRLFRIEASKLGANVTWAVSGSIGGLTHGEMVEDDLVLEENMTLTVDFPCLEPGWGNCHLEDLVRITKDGVEPLGTVDDPLILL